ncbi:MAG: hypothetical protein QM784_22490 [Polyangiaceae bacterium]
MGKAPELVRIRRKPIALVRTSPKELWVIVNEEEIEGSFSYLQRSIIYWIHENETALVFEEAQVGHYVERWAPIPNGIVVQERLLAAPGEALRISMITKHGSRTLLKESFRAPVVFGTVRNQVVLALWTDGDKVRITNWDAQGRKFERIFEETSCGPDLFQLSGGFPPPMRVLRDAKPKFLAKDCSGERYDGQERRRPCCRRAESDVPNRLRRVENRRFQLVRCS